MISKRQNTGAMDGDTGRIIGNIEGQLEALAKAVQAMAEQNAEVAKEGREGRSKMYGRMEDVSVKVASVQLTVNDIDGRLKKVEPMAQDVLKWKERYIGARMMMAMVWLFVGGAVVSLATWLFKFVGIMPK
jgi:hypothetical protein